MGLDAQDASLDVHARMAEHDRLDALIADWCRDLDADSTATELTGLGIPAARVVPPHEQGEIETLVGRGFHEMVNKPVAGNIRVPRFPLNLSRGPAVWTRTAAPTLGQDNRDVLQGLLRLTAAEVDQLEADGVIGHATSVNLGW